MKVAPASDWSRTEPLARSVVAFAVVSFAMLASLLLVLVVGLGLLGGMRAYVAGEGLYAKAHKESVQKLLEYARSGDPARWREYEAAIAIPRADARARRLLERSPPEVIEARRALRAGGNHPEDVPLLVAVFRYGRWIPEMREAMALWARADARVEELGALADELRAARAADPARTEVLLDRITSLDADLSALEREFSATLGAGARRVRGVVLTAAAAAAAVALALGVLASTRLLQRMRRRDLRFRSILESSHDVVTILRADGTIVYNSPSVQRVLGWGPEELLGLGSFDLIHPDDRTEAARQLLSLTADPRSPHSAEYRFRHKDGSWRMLASTAGGSGELGERGEYVVSSRDITGRRDLEERLLEAQKLESVGRLAGGVAHDFNNLLTAILGSAELARADLPPGSPADETLGEIQDAAERAGRLTQQLLAFARRQVVATRVLDLAETVRGLEGLLRRLVSEDVELRMQLPDERVPVRCDPGQIEQVVVNLAVNARDAMPHGGTLEVAVARVEASPRPGAPPGPCGELAVHDTGVSIPEEIRAHVFEPFFTTKEQGRGTGLGLATCYGIARQAGGTIELESDSDRGTSFRVRLPLAADAADDSIASSAGSDVGANRTVLLVEDEAAVRRVAARGLRDHGWRVVEARSGPEALEAWGREPEVDVLVTDVVMPGMSGVELADRLHAERPGLAVLYVSGHTADAAMRARMQESAYLTKPFTPRGLAERVRDLVDG